MPTLNDDRLERMGQIADSADDERGDELEDLQDDDDDRRAGWHAKTQEEIDAREKVREEQEQEELRAEEKAKEIVYTIRVNGKDRHVTLDELIAMCQKVSSADEYLKSASEAHRTAMQMSQPPPRQEPEDPDGDDVALARAIQMGSEEEAAAAIRKLRAQPSAVTPDVVAQVVDGRMSLRAELTSLEGKYSTVLEHPALGDVFRSKLAKMQAVAPETTIAAAYEQIDREIRDQFAPMLEKAPTKSDRKATMSNVPTSAAARQSAPPDEDEDDSPDSVIAQMAKQRGQGRPVAATNMANMSRPRRATTH